MNKTIEKISETKSLFFEKINKIDKPLDSSRKRKGLKSIKLEVKKEKFQLTPQKYKGIMRLLQATICQ